MQVRTCTAGAALCHRVASRRVTLPRSSGPTLRPLRDVTTSRTASASSQEVAAADGGLSTELRVHKSPPKVTAAAATACIQHTHTQLGQRVARIIELRYALRYVCRYFRSPPTGAIGAMRCGAVQCRNHCDGVDTHTECSLFSSFTAPHSDLSSLLFYSTLLRVGTEPNTTATSRCH